MLKALINILGGILTAAMWIGLMYIAIFHLSDAGGIIHWVN